MIRYVISVNDTERRVSPEEIGATIIGHLRSAAERNLTAPVKKAVMSVPAEFDAKQRNYTIKAGNLAGNVKFNEMIFTVMCADCNFLV